MNYLHILLAAATVSFSVASYADQNIEDLALYPAQNFEQSFARLSVSRKLGLRGRLVAAGSGRHAGPNSQL